MISGLLHFLLEKFSANVEVKPSLMRMLTSLQSPDHEGPSLFLLRIKTLTVSLLRIPFKFHQHKVRIFEPLLAYNLLSGCAFIAYSINTVSFEAVICDTDECFTSIGFPLSPQWLEFVAVDNGRRVAVWVTGINAIKPGEIWKLISCPFIQRNES